MTRHRGWELPESHLLPDAVVAFVDQELSTSAYERAATHVAECPSCAEEVAAQRLASSAVRDAGTPAISTGFLAHLREIPQHTDVRTTPENLAVSRDGQLVTAEHWEGQMPVSGGIDDGVLGGSPPLGTSPNTLGSGPRLGGMGRRAAQGAGVVVSGLVLSALALVATSSDGNAGGAGTKNDHQRDDPFPTGGLRARNDTSGTSSTPPVPPSLSPVTTATTLATAEQHQDPR